MTRLFIGTALAILASAALAAQSPSTPVAPSAAAQAAPKPVTYTGCLKAGATTGTFQLADAARDRKTTNKKGALTPAAAAAVASNDSTASEKTFAIVPSTTGLDLSPQIGHEIDAVGTLSKQTKKQPQLFTVTSVTMRTDHCW